MAASSRGLLVSGIRVLSLPLALSLAVFGPLGCSEDSKGSGVGGEASDCDPIDNPCKRTQICVDGACENAPRCPEGEDSECPQDDGDGDPLFCEFTFCVEACQTGGLHCPPPEFRCDLISKTCVPDDDSCGSNDDCAEGKFCHIQEGDTRGVCQIGEICAGDGDCEGSIYGPLCHPTDKFCVSCYDNEHCTDGIRSVCNLESYSCDLPPVKECLADVECCPPDTACEKTCDIGQTPSRCVEGIQCFEAYDCLEERGRYCFRDGDDPGQCRTKCDQGGTCPVGFDCQPDGTCALKTCTGDEDCPEGQQCIDPGNGQSVCRASECTQDQDCVDQGRGCSCEELIPGFGKCQDCECQTQGQPGACAEAGWVCDLDPNAGPAFIHCQEPCQDRAPPQCFIDTACDVGGGTGLCEGGPGIPGCMTSESCANDDACCDYEAEGKPLCAAANCGLNPCRNTASCAEGQICLNDECVAQGDRPVFCEGSDECAGRQVCANAGACELVAPCQGDQDCPGRLTCNPESGRCNECEADGDCLSAGIGVVCGDSPSGRYRKCLEPAGSFCEDDGQCTGSRTCNGGFCGPDPAFRCEDDWMSRAFATVAALEAVPPIIGNHTALQAAPLGAQTYQGLILCDGRDDWFKVDLQQGQDIEVTLIYDVNGGTGADLSLELREGNTLFARSDSMGGVERVGINGAPFDGSYFLRVSGVPGAAATPYHISLKTGEICVDDPLEGPEGNDSQDNATAIEPGLVPDLILCQAGGDGSSADFFRLQFEAGTNTTIVVNWDEADGRVTGSLFDANGGIDDAANVTKQEFGDSIRWDVAEFSGGQLFVRLNADAGNDAEIRYEIRVLAECSAIQRGNLCTEADGLPLQPGPIGANGQPEFYEAALSGNTCLAAGIGNCFSGSCDPLRAEHVAKEMIWRLDTTAPPFNGERAVEVNVRYQVDDDWRGTVSFRSGCEDDAGEASCRLDPRRPYRETLLPGVHNILVDGSGEECGPFTLDLTVRPIEGEINRCDSCVSRRQGVCTMGDPDDASLAQAEWDSVGGQAADDFNYVLQLRDTTALSNPNQFEGGVGSCIDVANARFSPDTVYEFTTPEGAPDGCRFTARLAAQNFVGGLVLRDGCPSSNELACKFENNFVPKVLFVEELAAGTYTLWVKGSGALQAGDFVLDLQCTPPGGDPPGNSCVEAVNFALDPLVDRQGFQLGHIKEALVGQNIGASDEGDHGADCRAVACNPAVDGDCGSDIWYSFEQEQLASVWFAELEADYPATFTVYRGGCEGLEQVACGSNNEAIELFDFAPGEYIIVVDAEGADARGGHSIDITSIEQDVVQPPNDACQGEYNNPGIRAADIGFEIGRRVQIDGSTFGANHDRNPQTCGDPDADARDVVYVYTADREHTIEARVFGGFDHNLYIRRADCLNGPEVVCAEGDIQETDLNAGTYYIFVDGLTPEQQGGFTLQVSFLPPAGECPQADGGSCDSAQEIVLDDELSAEFLGNNGSCANNETPPDGCAQPGEEGADTVYYFDLPVAARVNIITDAVFDEASYLRRADDAAGCALAEDLFCSGNDPVRINPADALPAGRYYLIVDAEFGDERLGPVEIIIRAIPLEDPPANDTCEVVRGWHASWVAHQADPDNVPLNISEVCLEDDNPQNLARCGLLDQLLEDNNGTIVVAGDTSASLPNYDVRPHDPDNDSTCEADGGLRDAARAKDVAYRFHVERPSSFSAAFANIDLGNALLSLRPVDGNGGCGGEAADSELYCNDEPPNMEIERLAPGDYYLIVNGFDAAAAGRFTLQLDLQPLPERPLNDHCHPQVANQNARLIPDPDAGEAWDVAGDVSTFTLDGTLIAAADDYQPVDCELQAFGLGSGPDVVYAIDLPYDFNEVSVDVETVRLARNFAPYNLIAYMRTGACHDGPPIPGACNVEGRNPPDPSIDLTVANRRFLAGQRVYLVIDGFQPEDQADNFELTVTVTEVDVEVGVGNNCDADDIAAVAFDGELGNDPEQVIRYSGQTTAGNTNDTASDNCGGDTGPDAVHRLTVPEDSLVDVTFVPDGWSGNVSIRGGDDSCNDAAAEVSCGGNQVGPVTLAAGDYWIWVDGNTARDFGDYLLQIHKLPVVLTPQNDTCDLVTANNVLWNDGDPQDGWPANCVEDAAECGVIDFGDEERVVIEHVLNAEGTDQEEGSCGGIGGRERIYRIDLPDPAFLTVNVTFTVPRLKVYLRGACDDPGSEVVIDPDQNPPTTLCEDARRGRDTIVTTPQLAEGSYYLVVDGRTADDVGNYTIVVNRNASPPNDDCDGATVLDIGRGGQVAFNGNTGVAGPDYTQSCGGEDAEDMIYTFDLEVPADVSIRASASFDGAISLRRGTCDPAAGGEETHCELVDIENDATIAVDNMAPGAYWLHIDGQGDGDNGGFAVSITVLPLTPPNNECADSAVINMGIGGAFEGPGTLIGATNDDAGPNECPNEGPDVFYSYAVEVTPKDFMAKLLFGSDERCSGNNGAGAIGSPECGEYGCCPEEGEVCIDPDDNGVFHCEVANARFDHYLFTRAEDCGAALQCGATAQALILPDVEPGSYTLVVDGGEAGNRGDFTLVAETRIPGNSECLAVAEQGSAYEFVVTPDDDPNDGVAPTWYKEGTTVGAAKSYVRTLDECTPENTDNTRDVVYELSLAEPLDFVDVTVTSRHFNPIFWATFDNCAAGEPYGCWVGDDDDADGLFTATATLSRLQAGRHFLTIDAGAVDALGEFTVKVEAGPVLTPPENVTCDTAEELVLEYTNTIPIEGTAEVIGSTIGATADYAPAVCENVDANGIQLMADTADVVYCFLIDTGGNPTTADIQINNAPGGLPFFPTGYLYIDKQGYEDSGQGCSADFEAADCGADGCCPVDHPLCKDYDYDNATTCYAEPTCEDANVDDCASGNPSHCGNVLAAVDVGVGAVDEEAGGAEPPEGAEAPAIYKYFLIVDAQDQEGDFEITIRTTSSVNVCDGPIDVDAACDADAGACCAEGTVCRCQDLDIRPCADVTDLDCCNNDANNPPTCVGCAQDPDCPEGEICNLQNFQCEAGCRIVDGVDECDAPTFCLIADGADSGQCVECNATDPVAGGDCADNDDCADIDGRAQFCSPTGDCSECGIAVTGNNGVCNAANSCVGCTDAAHCVGVENNAGDALTICQVGGGNCVQCETGDACDNDDDCPDGTNCGSDGNCSVCDAAEFCTAQGACAECANNGDCDEGELCNQGTCQAQDAPPPDE